MQRLLSRFVRYKIYFDRSKVYVGYLQFFMLVFITLKQMDTTLPIWMYIAGFVLFCVVSVVVGYIDTKLGIRAEEQKNYSEQNPTLMEILEILKRK